MRNPARLRIAALSMFLGVAMMSLLVGGFAMAHDNEIVNANILTRVLHLKIGEMTGTAFTVEVDGRQYLITAKHLTGESGIEELGNLARRMAQIQGLRCGNGNREGKT